MTETNSSELSRTATPAGTELDTRLQSIEKRVGELKPAGKDAWDKFEKLSSVIWGIVTLLVSLFVTGRIENALKERQLHLENVKDMQQLIQQLDKADASSAMSYALALGAHGRYAVAPMIQVLQTGGAEHRPAAMAGLRAAAAVDADFVCQQLTGVIRNHTRMYQVEVHQSAAEMLGDLNCQEAAQPLRDYLARLDRADPQSAPFAPIPGSQGVTKDNIKEVQKQAQNSLDALTQD